jgi:hypothetical protein
MSFFVFPAGDDKEGHYEVADGNGGDGSVDALLDDEGETETPLLE